MLVKWFKNRMTIYFNMFSVLIKNWIDNNLKIIGVIKKKELE